MANVLIIDDDEQISSMLSRMVQRLGHHASSSLTLSSGLDALRSNAFDVVFLDVRLPDGNGLEALSTIRETASSPEVIIMTGFGDRDGAEMAIRNGAWDYLQKPISSKEITLPLKRVLQYRENLSKVARPPVALRLDGIVGHSPAMRKCFDLVAQAASSEASVLITGETGTGKELFAKAIHLNSSRAKRSFVVVDCAALPETLLESALFGYVKGAFTGADRTRDGLIRQADGGVLFLDEVGELSLPMQKSFLRVLQEHRFRPVGGSKEIDSDFRVVAATNRDLDEWVKTGKIREDLLYRLRGITIDLPPLRKHREDINDLVAHYVAKLCWAYGHPIKGISPDFLEVLTAYDWPGNVRELINTIDRALAASGQESLLFPKHLPKPIRIKVARGSISNGEDVAVEQAVASSSSSIYPKYREFRRARLAEAQKTYLMELMALTRGDMKQACQISGLGRTRLYTLMKKHGISRTG